MKTPIYKRVEAEIRSHIDSGRWSHGQMLPGRLGLARAFEVSVGTLERALDGLISDGTLRADHRRGTFVAKRASDDLTLPPWQVNAKTKKGVETLGVIASYPIECLGSSDDLFFWIPLIANSLSTHFLGKGERTLMFNVYPSPGASRQAQRLIPLATALESLQRQGATAVAIIDIHNEIDDLAIETFWATASQSGVPIVYVSSRSIDVPIPHIFVDSARNGAIAARLLFELGHKRLTFVSPIDQLWVRERFESARHVALRLGLADDAVHYATVDNPFTGHQYASDIAAASYQCGRALFTGSQPHEALIAADDLTACSIIDAGEELGLLPGRDYSIIGSDDAPKSMLYGLTTLRPPLERLGEEAAIMLQKMAAQKTADQQISFQSQLILRKSTRDA